MSCTSLPRNQQRLLLFGLFMAGIVGHAEMVWAAGEIGWLRLAAPTADDQKVADAVRLVRHAKVVSYDEKEGLYPCDKVTLTDASATVSVVLTNGTRLRLSSESRMVPIPCEASGQAANLVNFLSAVVRKAQDRASFTGSRGQVLAGSRGPESLASSRSELSIPALIASTAVIAAGDRSLFVAWEGGTGPYSVEIATYPDGKPVVTQSAIATRSVTLAKTRLAPGRYVLIVKGKDGLGVKEDELHVVAAREIPPMPDELSSAPLKSDARMLFYADYLIGLDDGRWTLEALQQAATLARDSAAAREWLKDWGG